MEAADLRAVKLWAVSIMEDNCEVHGCAFEGLGRISYGSSLEVRRRVVVIDEIRSRG